MKNINDKKLYLYFGIVTLALGLIFGAIAIHSKYFVENRINTLLSEKSDVDKNLKEAFILLREPHVFGKYEYFNQKSQRIKAQIAAFDSSVLHGEKLSPDSQIYLRVILSRREKANILTVNTMVFVFLLSFISFVMFFVENRKRG